MNKIDINKLEKLCLVLISIALFLSIALFCQSLINFKIRDEVRDLEKEIKELTERIDTVEEQNRILDYKYWDLYFMGVSSYDGEYEYYE